MALLEALNAHGNTCTEKVGAPETVEIAGGSMALLLFLHGHFDKLQFIGGGLFAYGALTRIRQSLQSFSSTPFLEEPAGRFSDEKDSCQKHNWGAKLNDDRYSLMSAGV